MTYNQSLPIVLSTLVSVNHHDLFEIETHLGEMFQTLKNGNTVTDGLFINTDAGFDSRSCQNNKGFLHKEIKKRR